jgi:hypothetical protein
MKLAIKLERKLPTKIVDFYGEQIYPKAKINRSTAFLWACFLGLRRTVSIETALRNLCIQMGEEKEKY